MALIEEARALGMSVVGLCFHVGSQSLNPYIYVDTILVCKKIYDLCALAGIKMEVLDIGGGFPVRYVEKVMPIGKFCEPIRNALKNYFPNTRIIAEPGRAICGDGVVLVTRVIGKSVRNNVQWYYIDDGLYNSFSGRVFDQANYRIVAGRTKGFSRCILAGPTCDSFDVISSDLVLPELEIGDILLVPCMGAYTNVSATEFNLLPKAKMISIN
jgi:ornithine decarboxylase